MATAYRARFRRQHRLAAVFPACELWLSPPSAGAIAAGIFSPSLPDRGAVLIAAGMIGATVMPHNLLLHSALISEERKRVSERPRRARFYAGETFWALMFATFINAAILIAGARIHGAGDSFRHAFTFISSDSGGAVAALFGVDLMISGLASTVTATLSNDYVVAAFSPIQISPLLRRTLTAAPATLLLMAAKPIELIVWSQAILALPAGGCNPNDHPDDFRTKRPFMLLEALDCGFGRGGIGLPGRRFGFDAFPVRLKVK
ncbi:MAG: divalent metal cation transporter [Candidatus Binataceae bacterium]